MKYNVEIISDAEEDVFEIYKFIRQSDSPANAEYVFGEIMDACHSLSAVPKRGHLPPELQKIGILDFREIHFKPYRIIYQIINNTVFIHCILDGRRDLQELLERRLLR